MIDVERLKGHMSADQIKMKMWTTAGFRKVQKWLVIYNILVDPRPVAEIAKHTGLSEGSVYRIIADYNKMGPEGLEGREVLDSMRLDPHPGTVAM